MATTTTKIKYNVDYIQKALAQAYQSENLHVEHVESATRKQNGENFCSDIYRLTVKYRKTPESPIEVGKYVIKNLYPDVAVMGTCEKLLLLQILPAMDEILGKASPLTEHKLNANCLYCDPTPGTEDYLLEDLNALSYTSMDRQKGLDLYEAKICLQKLGQFHAASMVLIQEQPELVGKLPPSQYSKGIKFDLGRVIIINGTNYAAKAFANEMPEIAAKMKAQIPDAYAKRMRSVVDPKNSAFNVITHGDLWVNNILIDKAAEKAVFVDFQSSFVGSPAIDLHFLFYTSLELDVLLHSQTELLQHYHESLTNTLKACHYTGSIPTFQQVTDEIERCLLYGYYAAVCELPICCATREASEDFGLHTFEDDEVMLKKRGQLFSNPRFLKTVRATLPIFHEKGVLETP
ncbi:uncharacterized protein Dwil_GK11089 [Drosophila willistoni]|uniref:CHK kinase-like domain-containing protein n=1 Tax=Drosophila willistoni TaxID=7260 RepID=B4N473_DROWI|nr:uncharacterized protein LOC6645397 [Drosophila willistoni]EDW78947.2 uncharacterized protein Dwil_GK11089 [Drosophila willistoni]